MINEVVGHVMQYKVTIMQKLLLIYYPISYDQAHKINRLSEMLSFAGSYSDNLRFNNNNKKFEKKKGSYPLI
jgi:hypothetical protein